MITPEDKQKMLEFVSELLDRPDVTASTSISVLDVTPKDGQWREYKPGKGRRFRLEIPCGKGEFYMGGTE